MTSAKDIVITAPPAIVTLSSDALESEVTAIFRRVRKLIKDCGAGRDKHDRANILISACIDEGLDTSAWIVGTARHLGFVDTHIRITLRKGIGERGSRDESGDYSNLM
jgi:hypothetical protein